MDSTSSWVNETKDRISQAELDATAGVTPDALTWHIRQRQLRAEGTEEARTILYWETIDRLRAQRRRWHLTRIVHAFETRDYNDIVAELQATIERMGHDGEVVMQAAHRLTGEGDG